MTIARPDGSRPRVLFVTYYFPPASAIGTVRTGKTARYLSELGWDVRVVTARNQKALEATLPMEIPEACVWRVTWPSPDHLLSRLLAHRRAAAARASSVEETPGAITRIGAAYRELFHIPDEGGMGIPIARRAVLRRLREWRPDVVFASGTPHSALILAHTLARDLDLPWIGELRDLWTENHYYRHSSLRRAIEQRIEKHVLGSAHALVTVSEPLADHLRRSLSRPAHVILNGFDPEDYPASASPPRGPLVLTYTGQVYAGQQDVLPLVEALGLLGAQAANVHVRFYGRFLGSGLQEALARAATLAVRDSIEIHASIPHREALLRQRTSDILLLLSWLDPRNPGVYTGKLFEYIGARRPILAVGRGTSVADDMIRDRALGLSLYDPPAIARQLREWSQTKQRGQLIADIPAERGAGLTRKDQTALLSQILATAIGIHDHT